MNNLNIQLAASAALCLAAGTVAAQSYTFKIGAAHLDPRATSSDLEGVFPAWASNAAVPPGVQLAVQPTTFAYFSLARSLSENWEVEAALGVPPKADVKLRVSDNIKALAGVSANAAYLTSFDDQAVARITAVIPTIFLNYKLGAAASTFRPFVGVGINYSHITATTTGEGDSFYAAHGAVPSEAPVKIKLTDSIGLAFQAGVSYKLDKNWSLNASWLTAAVKNNLTITTPTSQQTGSYRYHPSVFTMTVGYQF
jgi:outer membrane protein